MWQDLGKGFPECNTNKVKEFRINVGLLLSSFRLVMVELELTQYICKFLQLAFHQSSRKQEPLLSDSNVGTWVYCTSQPWLL